MSEHGPRTYQCSTCPFTTNDPRAAYGHEYASPPRGWLGENERHPVTDEPPAADAPLPTRTYANPGERFSASEVGDYPLCPTDDEPVAIHPDLTACPAPEPPALRPFELAAADDSTVRLYCSYCASAPARWLVTDRYGATEPLCAFDFGDLFGWDVEPLAERVCCDIETDTDRHHAGGVVRVTEGGSLPVYTFCLPCFAAVLTAQDDTQRADNLRPDDRPAGPWRDVAPISVEPWGPADDDELAAEMSAAAERTRARWSRALRMSSVDRAAAYERTVDQLAAGPWTDDDARRYVAHVARERTYCPVYTHADGSRLAPYLWPAVLYPEIGAGWARALRHAD